MLTVQLAPGDKYKHRLAETYIIQTGILQPDILETSHVILRQDGFMKIKFGYAWDGASGPAVDTPSNRRASLVHDALYQLIKKGLLSKKFRKKADKLYRKICLEDGMNPFRAWLEYRGVRMFGWKAVRSST